ncbi:Phytanoyl-CoA dioxygenase [Trinorchestia longiramus]|nr:Phytanoyl-CoA dioxygenase [Trinorchestia longiramus]KAF2360984.1 Phytanoyl-CoA dioxygenase [Trinorchestia longiramus]
MAPLTKEQKAFYEENGYIVLDVLSADEIEEISAEYDFIFKNKAKQNLEATWKGNWDRPASDTQVLSVHGLQMHSAVFNRLLLNQGMLDACECIMNSPNVLLHHTKAHTKPPGKGSPFPMHQDYHYFPFKDHSMVAVFFNLDDSSPANGGLCVYPGSHKLGPQDDKSDDPSFHYLDKDKFPIEKATPLTLKKGQVVIFSYLLVHGSYPNTSEHVRRMFLVQLREASDEPTKLTHRSPCQDLVLRGRNVNRDADITRRHTEEK